MSSLVPTQPQIKQNQILGLMQTIYQNCQSLLVDPNATFQTWPNSDELNEILTLPTTYERTTSATILTPSLPQFKHNFGVKFWQNCGNLTTILVT